MFSQLDLKRRDLVEKLASRNEALNRIRRNLMGLQLEFKTIIRLKAQIKTIRNELKQYPLIWEE